jgi:type VI secretion system protein ImpE
MSAPAVLTANQLFQAGRVDDAVQALGSALRADPMDVRARTFLFELLCFAGQYDRAAKQLDIIADTSKEAGMGALLYRSALHAERTRQELFQTVGQVQGTQPTPSITGTLNGQPFTRLSDADPRIGARLEVFAAGQYTWIPLEHVADVRMEEPKRLRDLMWAPASVKAGPGIKDFEFGEVIIPCISPLSWRHADWQVRLGHEVAWEMQGDDTEIPLGPKMLQVDDDLVSILEVRELIIAPAESPA